ncbi:MAG: tRNA adenosine(34) deaminase TadA [Psittacicella sp.]
MSTNIEKSHEYYMNLALEQANEALEIDEVPIGALIINEDGDIISKGFNKTIANNNPCSHAEIEAIIKASDMMANYRLVNLTLYTTVEPCPMCAGAILNSRIKTVVYGTKEPKTGALGSLFNLFDYQLNHRIEIISGILENESRSIIQNFFKEKRKKKS